MEFGKGGLPACQLIVVINGADPEIPSVAACEGSGLGERQEAIRRWNHRDDDGI